MKTKSTETVFESTALGYLGSRSKAIKADLRNLPHEVIDRGSRMTYARRYQVADVLALRKARWEKMDAELKEIKRLFK